MTLAARFSALNSKFIAAQAAVSGFPAGVQDDVALAKAQTLAMATAVPAALTAFYNQFSNTLQMVNATVKSIGDLQDSPANTICGVVAFTATGDFLQKLEERVQGLLDRIAAFGSNLGTALTDLMATVATTVGFSTALADIQSYVNTAKAALQDFAETVGISHLKNITELASCLASAAEFTAVRATLVAQQIASLNISPAQAAQMSLTHTNIKSVSQTFMQNMQQRLAALS